MTVPKHGHTQYATDDWLRRTRAALQGAVPFWFEA